jgi:hypothetical protein
MIRSAAVPEYGRSLTHVRHDDIDKAVAVQVAKCRATAGARTGKRFPGCEPAEFATVIPRQKGRLLVGEVPGRFFDVI